MEHGSLTEEVWSSGSRRWSALFPDTSHNQSPSVVVPKPSIFLFLTSQRKVNKRRNRCTKTVAAVGKSRCRGECIGETVPSSKAPRGRCDIGGEPGSLGSYYCRKTTMVKDPRSCGKNEKNWDIYKGSLGAYERNTLK